MSGSDETKVPAWSLRLAADLRANDDTAKSLVAGMSCEQLNWQPYLGSWSVGQCLEHLCLMNDAYLPSISIALAGKPIRSVEEISPGWLGRWLIRNFAEPSPTSKRVQAPGKIRPAARVELAVLERFLTGNQQWRDLILRACGKDINRIRFWNPLVPGMRFTVGTGLEIIARHERRHLLQAKRVRESPNFPG